MWIEKHLTRIERHGMIEVPRSRRRRREQLRVRVIGDARDRVLDVWQARPRA
jgi:hypothetical protein